MQKKPFQKRGPVEFILDRMSFIHVSQQYAHWLLNEKRAELIRNQDHKK